jgi:hypothetical protein
MVKSDTRRRLATVIMMQQRYRHPIGHAVEQRNFDPTALAGHTTADQRLENGTVGIEAGGDITD